MTTHHDLAHEIYERINASDDYSASFWDKNPNETRVYVKTYGGKKSKDCGYVSVSNAGVERHLSRQGGTIEALYSDLLSTPLEQEPTYSTATAKQQLLDEEGNDWHVADGKPEDY